jgi:hypothetical protein
MLLDFLDNPFLLDLSFETAKGALNGLAVENSNFCHICLRLSAIKSSIAATNPRPKLPRRYFERPRRGETFYGNDFDLSVQKTFDIAEQRLFFSRHQRYSLTGVARSPGAPDAMDVVLGDHRKIEVDDHWQVIDIEAARGDVGRNQNAGPPKLEILKGTHSRVLALVPMDRFRAESAGRQVTAQPVGPVFGSAEDQCLPGVLLQQMHDEIAFLLRNDGMRAMCDFWSDCVRGGDLHLYGIFHEPGGECLDFRHERR